MHLARYLDHFKIRQEDFAAKIGVEQGTVGRYVSGLRIPRPKIMRKITEATDGVVRADDFLIPPAPRDGRRRRPKGDNAKLSASV